MKRTLNQENSGSALHSRLGSNYLHICQTPPTTMVLSTKPALCRRLPRQN